MYDKTSFQAHLVASLMSQLYDKWKDEDGFLYVAYGDENFYGR